MFYEEELFHINIRSIRQGQTEHNTLLFLSLQVVLLSPLPFIVLVAMPARSKNGLIRRYVPNLRGACYII